MGNARAWSNVCGRRGWPFSDTHTGQTRHVNRSSDVEIILFTPSDKMEHSVLFSFSPAHTHMTHTHTHAHTHKKKNVHTLFAALFAVWRSHAARSTRRTFRRIRSLRVEDTSAIPTTRAHQGCEQAREFPYSHTREKNLGSFLYYVVGVFMGTCKYYRDMVDG